MGHEVVAIARSAREAIQYAAAQRPDLVLMDICLQGEGDGIKSAEYIYLQLDLPVIYLTAHADERTLQRATETSPFGYLIKPFQEADLHSTIQIALRRHQLEQAIKAVQQWYATTLISIADATIATDVDGFVAFMNPTAEILTGWTQEDALGAFSGQVLELVQEKTELAIANPILTALCQSDSVTLEEGTWMRSWDGSQRPIAGCASPIRSRNGEMIGGVLVFQDISDQWRSETKLQQANDSLERTQDVLTAQLQERTAQLQQASACAQLVKRVLDQVHVVCQADDATQEPLLRALGQTLGVDYCWMTLHDSDQKMAVVKSEYAHRELLAGGSLVGEWIEIESWSRFYLRLFQQSAWINPAADLLPSCYQPFAGRNLQLLICPIANQQGVIGEVGIVKSDPSPWAALHVELITQVIRQAQIALEQSQRSHHLEVETANLERLHQLNQDFLQVFSHELRMPLTNLRMAVEMIQQIAPTLKLSSLQNTDPQKLMTLWKRLDRYVEILQQEWAHECQLVQELSEFQTADWMGAGKRVVQLQHWLPDWVYRFAGQMKQQHRLSYSIPADCAAVLVSVPVLERILMELLHGVCKVTPIEEEVRVTVEQPPGLCRISVVHVAESEMPERRDGLALRIVMARKLAIALQGDIEADYPNGTTRLTLVLSM
jgi:PAS domain S-box-containing protein